MPALVVALLVVPIIEIAVIVAVGHAIGAWPTLLLLLVWSAFGAWLVKREGRRAWTALRATLGSGRLPGRELADAALVLVGGVLLVTPGFVTDLAGLFLILPPTRPLARRALLAYAARRSVIAPPLRVRMNRVDMDSPYRARPDDGASPVIDGTTIRRDGGDPVG